MIDYFKLALSKYAQFTGRSRRSEYWYFQLVYALVAITLLVPMGIAAAMESQILAGLSGIAYAILTLGLIVPSIAVLVRRLHDTGRSGWWYFVSLVPLIGGILLLVWLAQDSQPGTNEYGPNPKGLAVAGNYSDHLVD